MKYLLLISLITSVCLFLVLEQQKISQRDLKTDKNLNNQTLRKDRKIIPGNSSYII